jgi:hypothetical protein
MKNLFLILFLILSFLSKSQNVIEVSLTKKSSFALYGKDSIHNMLKNTELRHYSKIYEPTDIKFIINKKSKKIYRFKNGNPFDTLSIKSVVLKDSIYTFTVIEKMNEMYSSYENETIDCYLVLDMRKNPINKKQPLFCYWWCWDIFINEEPLEYCVGNVSDYVSIK